MDNQYLEYKHLQHLAEVMLTFLSNTAEVERCFSKQNRIKTSYRNRLQITHLDMLIRMCSSRLTQLTFPFDQAYERWREQKRRRNGAMLIADDGISADEDDDYDYE